MTESWGVPDRIAIDALGYGWRVWDGEEFWSMVPTNPYNSPIPQPVTWFTNEATTTAAVLAGVVAHMRAKASVHWGRSVDGALSADVRKRAAIRAMTITDLADDIENGARLDGLTT